ncbi:MAG: protein-L-isoaspartate(D-aspartate) O-methyltransferase [Candidatus Marinimicrobia bacterium]|nr:protein-L-isoaspartate(D-aspartate) O-methyltransferase [Candidatus Neomarinimicrobiota bacterium]
MDDPFHLRQHGITDTAVLDAFHKVDRSLFIDASIRSFVNVDEPLPIGEGQTISQPSLVAHMTQILEIKPHHHILEIGTGSGFQTAIMAKIARKVTTVEVIPALYEMSKKRLTDLGFDNVSVILRDGHEGYIPHAPYDGIMVTAATPEIPEKLIDQMKDGGRMVIPLGEQHAAQRLMVISKNDDGSLTKKKEMWVRFVPFVKTDSSVK